MSTSPKKKNYLQVIKDLQISLRVRNVSLNNKNSIPRSPSIHSWCLYTHNTQIFITDQFDANILQRNKCSNMKQTENLCEKM